MSLSYLRPMDNFIIKKTQIKKETDEEWVKAVVDYIMVNGGKDSIHVVEVASDMRMQLLKEKGWHEPPFLNNHKLVKNLVTTDIKTKKQLENYLFTS